MPFYKKKFPAIHLYWKEYQKGMVEKLKATGQIMAIAGDGRYDSMGHIGKYCAHTIFCYTVLLIFSIK